MSIESCPSPFPPTSEATPSSTPHRPRNHRVLRAAAGLVLLGGAVAACGTPEGGNATSTPRYEVGQEVTIPAGDMVTILERDFGPGVAAPVAYAPHAAPTRPPSRRNTTATPAPAKTTQKPKRETADGPHYEVRWCQPDTDASASPSASPNPTGTVDALHSSAPETTPGACYAVDVPKDSFEESVEGRNGGPARFVVGNTLIVVQDVQGEVDQVLRAGHN